MKNLLMLILLSWIGMTALRAQNPHSNLFYYRPLHINPALLGASDYMDVRLGYRQQNYKGDLKWQTSNLTAAYPITKRSAGKRVGGIGLLFSDDQAQVGRVLHTQQLSLATAYNLPISGHLFLSIGIQGDYRIRNYTNESHTTGSQWQEHLGYNPSLPINESFDDQNRKYFSFGSGLLFYKELSDGTKPYQIGISGLHIKDNNRRVSAWAEYLLWQSKKSPQWTLYPQAYFSNQHDLSYWNGGIKVCYSFEDDNPYDMLKEGVIDFKVGYTNIQSIYFGIQIQQPNYTIGFAYDLATLNPKAPLQNNTEFGISIRKALIKRKKDKVLDDYQIGEVREFYKDKKEEKTKDTDNTATLQYNFKFELKREFKFGYKEAVLDQEDKGYLDELAMILHDNPQLKLEIIGHTDDIGPAKTNQELSLQRAEVVRAYLISRDIDSQRLKAIGKGEKKPLLPNNSPENRARNRRVEFIIGK